MRTATPPPEPSSASASASTGDFAAVLASARLLQQAEQASTTHALLRGKNLGLVCASEEDVDALLFRDAAFALGASVSHVRPSLSEPGANAEAVMLHTARLLGRLYDGIECQGLAPATVRELRRETGVPVFDGLACAGHPTAQLAQLLAGVDSPEKKRQLILQAGLLLALR